jgi:hypothetical protein
MEHLSDAITRAGLALHSPRFRDERGDVPGWVMITVMTAGIVVALSAIAGPALSDMLSSALNKVK